MKSKVSRSDMELWESLLKMRGSRSKCGEITYIFYGWSYLRYRKEKIKRRTGGTRCWSSCGRMDVVIVWKFIFAQSGFTFDFNHFLSGSSSSLKSALHSNSITFLGHGPIETKNIVKIYNEIRINSTISGAKTRLHTDNCSNYLPNKIRWKRTLQYKTVLDNKCQIYTSGKFSNYKKTNKTNGMKKIMQWRIQSNGEQKKEDISKI